MFTEASMTEPQTCNRCTQRKAAISRAHPCRGLSPHLIVMSIHRHRGATLAVASQRAILRASAQVSTAMEEVSTQRVTLRRISHRGTGAASRYQLTSQVATQTQQAGVCRSVSSPGVLSVSLNYSLTAMIDQKRRQIHQGTTDHHQSHFLW